MKALIKASVTGPDVSIPLYVVLPPGSGFCPGSAHGRHLMGFDEDRSANLRCVVVMPLVRFLGLT